MQRSASQPKKSQGQKKAKGSVDLRKATSSIRTGSLRPQKAPAAIASTQRFSQPEIRQSSKGGRRSVRIRHREFVASINGAIAFTTQKFVVNPGQAGTFPWLAPQAAQWEQYTMHACSFEYITRTGTATTGSVIMAPDYDASDNNPLTEAQMTSYDDAVEDATWKNFCCHLDKKAMHPMGDRKYVRSVSVAGDLKTYDVANFFLAVLEEGSAAAIGKLWVDYDVEFFVPQTSPSGLGIGPSETNLYSSGASQPVTSGVALNTVYGNLIGPYNPLNITVPSAGNFLLPAGAYTVDAEVGVTETGATSMSISAVILKNGIANASNIISTAGSTGTPEGTHQLRLRDIITSNGSDLFSVQVTVVAAAASAIALPPNTNSVMFQLA